MRVTAKDTIMRGPTVFVSISNPDESGDSYQMLTPKQAASLARKLDAACLKLAAKKGRKS